MSNNKVTRCRHWEDNQLTLSPRKDKTYRCYKCGKIINVFDPFDKNAMKKVDKILEEYDTLLEAINILYYCKSEDPDQETEEFLDQMISNVPDTSKLFKKNLDRFYAEEDRRRTNTKTSIVKERLQEVMSVL